ncbi:MAG: hypothetical protein J0L52_09595 [Caulobacterales bacterium]|nr:hypothetical protein [Caulobacterales bacterium]
MKRLFIALTLACGLAACSTALTPRDVVLRAADAEGEPVLVTMDLRVAAFGSDDGFLYLNAYSDYRDQRNVSIAVSSEAQADIIAAHGPVEDLVGRRIRVHGWSRRQTIYFISRGRQTGLYYFQTHLHVSRPDQIVVLD